MLLAIISLLYNGYAIYKNKDIPVSLSETAYFLKSWMFSIYCLIVCVLSIPKLFIIFPDNLAFIPFLFISGLLFSGFSPMFKKELDGLVHYTSAIISYVSFLIILILNHMLILYIICLSILILLKPKCYVYFAEILALIALIII